MSVHDFPPGSCVVCGLAEVARRIKPRSIAALRRACAPAAGEDRRAAERRDGQMDRRAFWRPTPDRRAEATERGRRAGDTG